MGAMSLRAAACALVLSAACGTGASSTYCAYDIGLVNAADVPNVGPIELCTTQYPTCTPPAGTSAGWECCVDAPLPADGGSAQCMPAAGASAGAADAGSE